MIKSNNKDGSVYKTHEINNKKVATKKQQDKTSKLIAVLQDINSQK